MLRVLIICNKIDEDEFLVRKCIFKYWCVGGIHLYHYDTKFVCFGACYFIFTIKIVFRGTLSFISVLQNCCFGGASSFTLRYKIFMLWGSYLYGSKFLRCVASSSVFTIQNCCVVGSHLLLYDTKLLCYGTSFLIFMVQNCCILGPHLLCLNCKKPITS
jgi:hypothetical protein